VAAGCGGYPELTAPAESALATAVTLSHPTLILRGHLACAEGALLAGSPDGMALLRWAGAAYLIWLGWGLLRHSAPNFQNLQADGADATPGPWRRAFTQGFLTNTLNPKVALFFLAFVPQFIRPDASERMPAFIALGTVFVVNATLVNLGLAWGVAALRPGLHQRPAQRDASLWLSRGTGALFVVLGLRLAWGDVGH